jgi:hypothetical protein
MPFIEQPMGDHVEKEVVPEGKYTLRIYNYKVFYEEDQTTPKSIMIMHEIDGEPDAKPVMFFMNLVRPQDNENTRHWKLAFQKGYLKRFGLDFTNSGFDPDEWMGATAEVNLVQAARDNEGNEIVNEFADREIAPVT